MIFRAFLLKFVLMFHFLLKYFPGNNNLSEYKRSKKNESIISRCLSIDSVNVMFLKRLKQQDNLFSDFLLTDYSLH